MSPRLIVLIVGLVVVAVLVWLLVDLGRRGDTVELVDVTVEVPRDDPTTTIPTTSTTAAPPTTSTTAVARTTPTVTAASVSSPAPASVRAGAWSCGGDLPPCWVLDRENPDRDLTVYNGGHHHEPGYTGGNPEGDSTASGKWQFVRKTWAMFMGYVNAADAPWWVQDEKARQTWAGGAGCSHWAAC